MKVLAPITVTESMLTSSTLPETDYAAWSSGSTYAVGDRVIYLHKVYESLQASNTNKVPTTQTTYWVEVGPTNRWAMFDGAVSTASSATTDITVTVTPGTVCDSVAVIAGIGYGVRVQMTDGATTVYDRTQSLDSTPITDWDEYFFSAQVLAGELLFSGLPRYRTASITVTVTAAAGTAQVGALVIGVLHDLGDVESGASAGITDYSRKETDDFGNTTLVRRSYAKRSSQRLILPTSDLRRVQALLSGLRATPAAWVGETNTNLFAPLVVFGWFRSFGIDISGPVLSYCTLEIEGLT